MTDRNAERSKRITRGSGNVFADLGFPDAAERQAKLRLAYALNRVLDDRKLSEADAAKRLRLTQPKVSALRHYKLVGFSLERLMNLLTAIDHDIEIMIRPKPRSRKAARIRVVAVERRFQATSISRYGRITRSTRSAFATRSSSFMSSRRLLRASMRASIATSRPTLFRNRKQSTTVRATL
jgi:predicted XRE-type DNA-binding protein